MGPLMIGTVKLSSISNDNSLKKGADNSLKRNLDQCKYLYYPKYILKFRGFFYTYL